jgi:hypothetical protein
MVLFSRKAYILDLGSSRFSGVARCQGTYRLRAIKNLFTFALWRCAGMQTQYQAVALIELRLEKEKDFDTH